MVRPGRGQALRRKIRREVIPMAQLTVDIPDEVILERAAEIMDSTNWPNGRPYAETAKRLRNAASIIRSR